MPRQRDTTPRIGRSKGRGVYVRWWDTHGKLRKTYPTQADLAEHPSPDLAAWAAWKRAAAGTSATLPDRPTVNDLLALRRERRERRARRKALSLATIDSDRYLHGLLPPWFLRLEADVVTGDDVDRVLTEVREGIVARQRERGRDPRPARSVNKLRVELGAVPELAAAVAETEAEPLLVEPPNVLTPAEQARVRQVIDDMVARGRAASDGGSHIRGVMPARYGTMLAVILGAGLRRSEVIGLTLPGPDGALRVRQRIVVVPAAVTDVAGGPGQELKRGAKSAAGHDRVVPLTPAVRAHIESWLVCRTRMAATVGPAFEERGLLFCTQTGGPVLATHLRRALADVAVAAGIDGPLGPHALRHTYGTRLLDAGVPTPTAMAALGHSDARMTARYQHTEDAHVVAAAAAAEAITDAAAQGLEDDDEGAA